MNFPEQLQLLATCINLLSHFRLLENNYSSSAINHIYMCINISFSRTNILVMATFMTQTLKLGNVNFPEQLQLLPINLLSHFVEQNK